MSFVIPKWTAHEVHDWKGLWVKTDDGDDELNEATCALINYLPVVGITEITAENVDDVWRRIAIYQALFGSIYSNLDNGQPLFLCKSDVERHVGIETEGTRIPFEDFCAKVRVQKVEEAESKLPSFVANGNRTLLYISGIEEK